MGNMRTIRYAEEVWTPTGIVDLIRFEDYKESDYSFCSLIDYDKFEKSYQNTLDIMSHHKLGQCKCGKDYTYKNDNCNGCAYHRHSYKIEMLVTCYECKISVQDFKSKNGHNFHGNKNYYVVPKEIFNSVKELVPDDIGIIVYYSDTNNYRIKKECKFREVSHELKERLLYDALKKWVDKCHYYYNNPEKD